MFGTITIVLRQGEVFCLDKVTGGEFPIEVDWKSIPVPEDGRYLLQGTLRRNDLEQFYWFEVTLPAIPFPEGIVGSMTFAGRVVPYRTWTSSYGKRRASFFVNSNEKGSYFLVATKIRHVEMIEKALGHPVFYGVAQVRGNSNGWKFEVYGLRFIPG